MATGSPFEPVDYEGTRYVIGQANNALIFPGLGLGVIAARATRVTDRMLAAAAHAVAALVDTSTAGSELLPRVERLRETSVAVAAAVATAAAQEGVSGTEPGEHLADRIRALMWEPVYRPVRPVWKAAARSSEPGHKRGSTGSLSRASTPNTHSCTR